MMGIHNIFVLNNDYMYLFMLYQVDRHFSHRCFGQDVLPGCFGQIKVQSRTFWPNAILTQKEALYELFMLLDIQFK